jgi:Na+/proline symporter
MSALLFLTVIICYFASLIIISKITSRKADDASYFIGNKQSPWYLVAFGMLSDSLSGVTYISVPGAVHKVSLTYFQVVIGYFLGYFLIVFILLPLYYRLNLISIYTYLRQRFGQNAQKTGSFYFLISRLFGAGGRLMLAIGVMQIFIFDAWNIHFALTTSIFISLMLIYTYKGGIKTLVYTDAFQSLFLIAGVVLSIIAIASQLDLGLSDISNIVSTGPYSKVIESNPYKASFWAKNIIGGALFTVAMTGLDQNMMQKNLSMKSLRDAQKNMIWFSFVMVLVNIFFLTLGILLYHYATVNSIGLPLNEEGKIITDKVFPTLAMNHFGTFTSLAFIIGLTAATFSSADSVLATLTTSFCIDFLGFESDSQLTHEKKVKARHIVHIGFAVALLIVILFLKFILKGDSAIDLILWLATLTYGPLIGLFAMGLFTKWQFNDRLIPLICMISPVLSYFISKNSKQYLGGYEFGNELILLNGALTFIFLLLLKTKKLPVSN